MIEQPAANTHIQELMEQYSDECCDFSDLRWLRETARRLVTTMPDSQARCILFALAEPPPSVPDAELVQRPIELEQRIKTLETNIEKEV